MGNSISSIMLGLNRKEKEETKTEVEDALNVIIALAEDKATLHYRQVVNDTSPTKRLSATRAKSTAMCRRSQLS
jgi:hypothetical protein